MPISQAGQVNISALNVPDTYVQIVPPQFLFAGVSTNKGGFVGTAAWGPVNAPQNFANYTQYAQIYGPTVNRLFDMGGHVYLASAQGGAGSLYGVRVTDGTDVAASATIGGMVVSGKWTGSLGNQIKVTLSQGSQSLAAINASGSVVFTSNPTAAQTLTIGGTAITFVAAAPTGNQVLIGANLATTLSTLAAFLGTSSDPNIILGRYTLAGSTLSVSAKAAGTGGNAFTLATTVTGATVSAATLTGGAAAVPSTKVTVTIPGSYPEQFDNIGAGLTGANLWTAIVGAINNGVSNVRGPSAVVIASTNGSTSAPVFGTSLLSGGTDGVTNITSATLIGVNVLPRTGMYALYGTGVSQAMLCDCADTTTFSTQAAFGTDAGCYMICTTPAGDTIANAVNELANAGIDTFTVKVMFGDWVYWLDTTNNVPMRLSSPQGVAMGVLCNLSPQNSSLNKPVLGIIGTQKSVTGIPYSSADLQSLGQAQMDVISNPEPGGNYFACRFGKNASSNQVIFGDEYTRVTYFLAKSLLVIGGYYIGQTQTVTERFQAKTSISAFLALCVKNGIIGTPDGSQAYQVILDNTNNNQQTVALGYQYAYVKAIYLGIVRYFIFNLEGGASVSISNTPPQN